MDEAERERQRTDKMGVVASHGPRRAREQSTFPRCEWADEDKRDAGSVDLDRLRGHAFVCSNNGSPH